MKSTVPLLTAPDFLTASYNTVRNSKTNIPQDFGLFDEQNLLDLHINQINRERYVKEKLMGMRSSSVYGGNDYYHDSAEFDISHIKNKGKSQLSNKRKSSSRTSKKNIEESIEQKKANIAKLKIQIEEIKRERTRILEEGQLKVRDYMAQLKKEQSEYSKITKKMREKDQKMNAIFLQEVTELDRRLSQNKQPLKEIKKKVKDRIQETEKGKVSISSIKLADESYV